MMLNAALAINSIVYMCVFSPKNECKDLLETVASVSFYGVLPLIKAMIYPSISLILVISTLLH